MLVPVGANLSYLEVFLLEISCSTLSIVDGPKSLSPSLKPV